MSLLSDEEEEEEVWRESLAGRPFSQMVTARLRSSARTMSLYIGAMACVPVERLPSSSRGSGGRIRTHTLKFFAMSPLNEPLTVSLRE